MVRSFGKYSVTDDAQIKSPVFLGFRTDDGRLRFWCPYCACFHWQGKTGEPPKGVVAGFKSPHCVMKNSPLLKSDFVVLEVGEYEPSDDLDSKLEQQIGRIYSGVVDQEADERLD